MDTNLIVFVFLFYKCFTEALCQPFMTDTYIKKDCSRIDNVIDKVIQFVFEE